MRDTSTPGGERRAAHPRDQKRVNTWQGDFPRVGTRPGDRTGTVPVDSYEPNGFGPYDTSGNV